MGRLLLVSAALFAVLAAVVAGAYLVTVREDVPRWAQLAVLLGLPGLVLGLLLAFLLRRRGAGE